MKLLHVADIHLDRAFEGIKTIPDTIKQTIIKANQQTLTAIVDSAIRNQVDLVILAGDTFHQSRTSIQTQAYFIHEMNRLAQVSISVALVFGNHDYYVSERYWFDFPDNMILFKKEEVETQYITTKNQESIALTGFSYEHPWIEESKLAFFPVKNQTDIIHIGLYHGDMNRKMEQNYAPFTLREMKEKNYDYWALGHIHQTSIVNKEPLIVYPGTPQGHTIKEQAVQGVAIVSFEKGQQTIHFEQVAQVGWESVSCSLENSPTLQSAIDTIEKRLLEVTNDSYRLLLKELIITQADHLGNEFQRSYESGELLHYLQQKLLEKSEHTIFPFRMEDKTQELEKKVLIPATIDLLHQLENNYLQPEIFTDTMNELLNNPLSLACLDIDEQWRKSCIQQANQKIMKKFIFQEE